MTQATATPEEVASGEGVDQGYSLADLLEGFADEGDRTEPTTTPESDRDASASPADHSPPVSTDETPGLASEPEDRLATALQRIEVLEANAKKYSDDMFGRVGSIEQVLKAQARTPAGQRVKVTLDDFGEFGREYQEMAEAQIKVINKALSELEVTGISPEFTSELIRNAGKTAETAAKAQLSQREVRRCREELSETHPDWEDTVGLPDQDGAPPPNTEYRRWLNTQPKEYVYRVLNSDSAVVIGRSIDKFRAAKQQSQAKTPASGTPIASRQQRLSAAVTVRTSGATPPPKREQTGYEAMLAAFNE